MAARRLTRLALLANIALAGGAVLSAASHLHSAGPAGRLLFGAYLGAVMAHFVIDAGLWRLREQFPRRFLATHLPYLLPGARSTPVNTAASSMPAAGSGCRWIGGRYRMPVMTSPLNALGRSAGPATLILSSLAGGAKHGYALTKDIEEFAGVRLAPGTLYEALSRLERQGLIEALDSDDRRRPYQLTAVGAQALREHLEAQRTVTAVGLHRLAARRGTA